MLLFWLSVLVNLIMYLTLRKIASRTRAQDAAVFISLLSFALLIVAIVTKDPIFSSFGVPPEFEWVVGLFITGLTSWKLYFNPLKDRLGKVESKVDVLHSELNSIKEDTTLIKEKILQRKF